MAEIVRLKPTRPCPICGKPSTQAHHPFCSGRCAVIDLNRWLSGAYVIPGKDSPDAEDEQSEVDTAGEDDET
ncbi:MAG: DNA gyrase inhibitor YacG [Devosia sp.]